MNNKKKLIPILIACLIVVGAVIFSLTYDKKDSPSVAVAGIKEIIATNQEKDTDGDGLKDWEETLWSTDIRKADTDGDGAGDGDEVKAERNPLIKGPNDKLNLNKQTGTQNGTTTVNLTETDKFARNFFTKYMELRKLSDGNISESERQLLITELAQAGALEIKAKVYTLDDMKYTTDGNMEGMERYGHNLARIIIENSPQNPESELDILNEAITKDDPNVLKRLDLIIKNYKNIIKLSSETPIPQNATELHLEYINSLSRVVLSIENMKKLYTDPILTFSSLEYYKQSAESLEVAVINLSMFFLKNNIQFGENTYGYLFTKNI